MPYGYTMLFVYAKQKQGVMFLHQNILEAFYGKFI